MSDTVHLRQLRPCDVSEMAARVSLIMDSVH